MILDDVETLKRSGEDEVIEAQGVLLGAPLWVFDIHYRKSGEAA